MNYSKTISKALKILNCFAGGNEYKSLSQIAEEVEIESIDWGIRSCYWGFQFSITWIPEKN